MATAYYWDGAQWQPLAVASGGGGGGGGTVGPPGPQGPAGESVEVFGPQPAQPTPKRKGDIWLAEQSVVTVSRLPETPEAPAIPIKYLSDEPDPLIIYLN